MYPASPRFSLQAAAAVGFTYLAVAACASNASKGQRSTMNGARDSAQPAADPGNARDGVVNFDISCPPDTQDDFNEALTLLHHMMYAQAEHRFSVLMTRSPRCAMAHWGIAMTLFHPVWPDSPSPAVLAQGQAALELATSLNPPTPRERAYIAAARAYYDNWGQRDEAKRLADYSAAMGRLHRRFPNDVDAAAFYALSLLAVAPPGDPTYRLQRQAAAMLTRLFEAHPKHPGVIHYGIHAHDYPPLAAAGLALADAYDVIAPNVPHPLHMPSHIYVRLGQWDKAIDWNRRSAKAAFDQPVGDRVSMHWVHALDYLTYAYLQKMEDDEAMAIVARLRKQQRYQPNPAAAYGLAAMLARVPLERRQWREAMSVRLRNLDTGFDWSAFPLALAVAAYTRGLGAARAGKLDRARVARAELDQLVARLQRESAASPKQAFWLERARIQRDSVAAWIAQAEGDRARAQQLMSAAADKEEVVGKHPTMPNFVQPARELYADLLLEQGQARQALSQYQASLRESPRRPNSLHGAAVAASQLGDHRQATQYLVELVVLPGSARPKRAIYVDALRRLNEPTPRARAD